MICKPCREAADALTETLSAGPLPPFVESACRDGAREGHARCLGRTSCDCQHKVTEHGRHG